MTVGNTRNVYRCILGKKVRVGRVVDCSLEPHHELILSVSKAAARESGGLLAGEGIFEDLESNYTKSCARKSRFFYCR